MADLMQLDYVQCGDCLEGLKELPSMSIDLVITDPPYDIDNEGAGMYKAHDKRYVKQLDRMKDGFSEDILDELCRVMKKVNCYIFCSQRQIIPLLDYFVVRKGCNYNIISWHKTNPIPACGNKYLTDTEYVLFFREPGVKLLGNFDTKHTYYLTPLNVKDKQKYGHPTIKPVSIINNFIKNSSEVGGIILDPFMGSGTTAVSAVRNKRHFVGYEINPDYYRKAMKRINREKMLKAAYG